MNTTSEESATMCECQAACSCKSAPHQFGSLRDWLSLSKEDAIKAALWLVADDRVYVSPDTTDNIIRLCEALARCD